MADVAQYGDRKVDFEALDAQDAESVDSFYKLMIFMCGLSLLTGGVIKAQPILIMLGFALIGLPSVTLLPAKQKKPELTGLDRELEVLANRYSEYEDPDWVQYERSVEHLIGFHTQNEGRSESELLHIRGGCDCNGECY